MEKQDYKELIFATIYVICVCFLPYVVFVILWFASVPVKIGLLISIIIGSILMAKIISRMLKK